MTALAKRHPRFGYRRIGALLRGDGWRLNDTRVQRLWRLEGLKVPQRQRKRRRLGHSVNSCTRRRAKRLNQVWTYDFVLDRIEDARRPKILTIVDEYSRECLALVVARSITAETVIATLARLAAQRGPPSRSDRTTAPNSSPLPCISGSRPRPASRSSSRRAARGRTPTARRSTASC
jgi:transposase InsO family protein